MTCFFKHKASVSNVLLPVCNYENDCAKYPFTFSLNGSLNDLWVSIVFTRQSRINIPCQVSQEGRNLINNYQIGVLKVWIFTKDTYWKMCFYCEMNGKSKWKTREKFSKLRNLESILPNFFLLRNCIIFPFFVVKLDHFISNLYFFISYKHSSLTTKIVKWRKPKFGRIDSRLFLPTNKRTGNFGNPNAYATQIHFMWAMLPQNVSNIELETPVINHSFAYYWLT